MNSNPFYIAGVGASAGGINSFNKFFPSIPLDTGISFIVIQHLAIDFKTQLDKVISKLTKLPVQLLKENTMPLPNHIYVLPGQLRVTIKDGILVLRNRTRTEIINNAIDEFLITLASDCKEKAIAIILSGMGNDGAMGVKTIQKNGGTVLVQDPESATFTSMPYAAINSDHPKILKPQELGSMLKDVIST